MTKSTELCSDVTVVIRAAGERTEALCKNLVLQQVPEEHVVVVHERPHNKMLRVSYELGLDGGLPWTLCVDADMLFSSNTIQRLLTMAMKLGKSAFGMEARLLDKFFGGDRPAGPHLYRTSMLDTARALIPSPGKSMRQESYVIRHMVARGHEYNLAEDVLSLHDHEQFYRDIYRKLFIQARRFRRVVPYLLSRAVLLLEDDLDFKIAAYGLCAGLSNQEVLVLDATAWIEEANVLLHENCLEEKGRLNVDAYVNYADEVLALYVRSKKYQEFILQHMQGLMQTKVKPSVRMRDRLRELGAIGALIWGSGRLLQIAGSSFIRLSERKWTLPR